MRGAERGKQGQAIAGSQTGLSVLPVTLVPLFPGQVFEFVDAAFQQVGPFGLHYPLGLAWASPGTGASYLSVGQISPPWSRWLNVRDSRVPGKVLTQNQHHVAPVRGPGSSSCPLGHCLRRSGQCRSSFQNVSKMYLGAAPSP